MNLDLNDISWEEFEFLCEDILREKGFVIENRPATGPDQGKDMIATRNRVDDMGIVYKEIWLVECKHLIKRKGSVKEVDLGNIELRMKLHQANRYLLVTSITVSETVKNQLKAISDDPETTRMATYWAKHDVIRLLEQYEHIRKRYLHSWEHQEKEVAEILNDHHFEAHRGAVLWRTGISAIFENRDERNIGFYKARLQERKIEELAIGHSSGGGTIVMLVRYGDASDLDNMVWEHYNPSHIYTLTERAIARRRIWQFLVNPIKRD